MIHTPSLSQHLRAPNDNNGNPRRCLVIYAWDATVLDVIDEGYSGFPHWTNTLHRLPTMTITATEYKDWLKQSSSL